MLESRLQKALDGLVARGIVGAAATIARPDGSLVSASAGLADRANGVSTGPAHLFKIGSVTKTFVAATLLHLGETGEVDLDTPIARWFPALPRSRPPAGIFQGSGSCAATTTGRRATPPPRHSRSRKAARCG